MASNMADKSQSHDFLWHFPWEFGARPCDFLWPGWASQSFSKAESPDSKNMASNQHGAKLPKCDKLVKNDKNWQDYAKTQTFPYKWKLSL